MNVMDRSEVYAHYSGHFAANILRNNNSDKGILNDVWHIKLFCIKKLLKHAKHIID